MEHIEGFLVPHKLILVNQALGFAFDYVLLIAHVSYICFHQVFFFRIKAYQTTLQVLTSELKLIKRKHLEEEKATMYINFQGYVLKK